VAQFTKQAAGDTWRLVDTRTGQAVARIWATEHVDRILRDANMAEAVANALPLSRAARRDAAVTAYNEWTAAGGRLVDFSGGPGGLSLNTLNDGSATDSNRHIYVGGVHAGYFHGEVYDTSRLLRYLKLGEDLFAAQQIQNATQRRNAIDAAIDLYEASGGVG
jgi:hypothetical protein